MLKLIVTDEKLIVPFRERVVCYVVQAKCEWKSMGTVSKWYGHVEEEFFSIVFMNGVVTLSMSEREMTLFDSPVNVAMSETLFKLIENSDDTDASRVEYFENTSQIDQKNIEFKDILDVLNWVPDKKMKFYENSDLE